MTTIKQLSLHYFLAVHNLFSLSVSICTYTISTRVLIKPPYTSSQIWPWQSFLAPGPLSLVSRDSKCIAWLLSFIAYCLIIINLNFLYLSYQDVTKLNF